MSEDKIEVDNPQREHVQLVKAVQDIVDLVDRPEEGAVGVFEDRYDDQDHPTYIVFNDSDKLGRFQDLLGKVGDMPGGNEKALVIDELSEIAGKRIDDTHLHPLYMGGEWKVDPKELLEDELQQAIADEDMEFYDKQRDHFSS